MSETLSMLLLSLTTLLSSIGGGITSLSATPVHTQVAQVVNSGNRIQFSLNKNGLQSLTYNGQSYLTPAPKSAPIVTNAVFKTPEGTLRPYGWLNGTLGHDDFYYWNTASTTVGPNGDYFQHIYHPGKPDSFTVKFNFNVTDSNTVKVTLDVTNNDPVNILTGISLNYFMQLMLPAAANNYANNIPIVLGAYAQNAKPMQFWNGSWGSVALWPDSYTNNSYLLAYYQSAGQTMFNPIISNSYSMSGKVFEDQILPGQTWRYVFNLRFGNTSDTPATLVPEAYTNLRNSFPYTLNWPDRRPIARAFIAEGTKRSELNPRGYLNDPLLDVSSTTLFRRRMLDAADRTLANMNNMDPKPQGLMIWDLEGQEFSHAFTYVGYPSKLAHMAPEMDRIADEYLKKFTDAGYKIGMTLRPSEFGSGATLPSTCRYDTNYELSDKFILTSALFPHRSYLCTATNTWSQRGLGLQVTLKDDSLILENLRSKVRYSRDRWGATIFYVDSTVYPGGTPINFEVWRTLQKEFPDTLFFPENEAPMYFGSTAPYNQANMGAFETPVGVRNIYPQAFSVIQATDGINYADPATYNRVLASVKAGNILMVDGWYTSPQNKNILKVYRDASAGATPLPVGVTSLNTPTPVVTSPPPATSVTPPYTPPTINTSVISNSPITLILFGNNPAYVQKGTQYNDPGVQVTGSTDYLFNIKANINGKDVGTVNNIQLNTQTTGTSTITYSVTDSQGKSATVTRTVVVYTGSAVDAPVSTQVNFLPATIALSRTLSVGTQGADVVTLQQFLISKGYLSQDTMPLGYFGSSTREAVKKFQCATMQLCTGDESTTGYGMVGQKTRVYINGNSIAPSVTSEDSRIKALMDQITSLLKMIEQLREQIAAMKK